ncbi:unnamed protein product [Gordionus sp. m RMFG-2023]
MTKKNNSIYYSPNLIFPRIDIFSNDNSRKRQLKDSLYEEENEYDEIITTTKSKLIKGVKNDTIADEVYPKLIIKLGLLFPFYGNFPFTLEKVYGTILLASRKANNLYFRKFIHINSNGQFKNKIKKNGVKFKAELRLVFADTGSVDSEKTIYYECSEDFATYHAGRLYYRIKISAFLGPLCYLTFVSVAYLSSRWGLPIITSLGPGATNPSVWPTLLRTGMKTTDLHSANLALINIYGWNDYFFLSEDQYSDLGLNSLDFSLLILQNSIPPPIATYKINSSLVRLDYNLIYPLVYGSTFARIFVLSTSVSTTKKILLDAYDLGMLTQGDYVFITVQLWKCDCLGGTYFDFEQDSRKEDLKKAYESLIVISAKVDDNKETIEFKNHIKNFSSKLWYFGNDFKNEEISIALSGLYEGLLIYAQALKEHLEEGGNVNEGNIIADMGIISIDNEGDRILDYNIWDFDPKTFKWKPALVFISEENILLPQDGYEMHWPIRLEPPPNEPKCGFRGDNPICFPSGLNIK